MAVAMETAKAPINARPSRLLDAFQRMDGLPALVESQTRVLRALAAAQPSRAELISLIESDMALAIAVLRAANSARFSRHRIATVPDAVEALTLERLEPVVSQVVVVDFFERPAGWDIQPAALRLHAVATQRIATGVAAMLAGHDRDEVATAALLHDVGKLLLAQAFPRYAGTAATPGTPAERLRAERAELGMDHTVVGGVLLRRWGLPDTLAEAVSHHHDPERGDTAGVVQLADMLVHYGQERPIDPGELLRTANALGLEREALRSLLHELPGADATRRPDEPSPLSDAELSALRGLAAGKTYAAIAAELGRSPSTIRSHLHSSYRKLGVNDRAQAVLLAAERGWL